MPPAEIKLKSGKISKSPFLTQSHPKGHVPSGKCEQPLDELTVQVWFLNDHPNLKYSTFCVSGTELRTDKRTIGQTDGRCDYLMPPANLSGRGHKNLPTLLSSFVYKLSTPYSNPSLTTPGIGGVLSTIIGEVEATIVRKSTRQV